MSDKSSKVDNSQRYIDKGRQNPLPASNLKPITKPTSDKK